MTDRELLELAARAAELTGLEWRNGSGCFYYDDTETGREEWNPLCDDAQAFRLVVKLNMSVAVYPMQVDVVGFGSRAEERTNDDPCAATRRAIVRAAAGTRRHTA